MGAHHTVLPSDRPVSSPSRDGAPRHSVSPADSPLKSPRQSPFPTRCPQASHTTASPARRPIGAWSFGDSPTRLHPRGSPARLPGPSRNGESDSSVGTESDAEAEVLAAGAPAFQSPRGVIIDPTHLRVPIHAHGNGGSPRRVDPWAATTASSRMSPRPGGRTVSPPINTPLNSPLYPPEHERGSPTHEDSDDDDFVQREPSAGNTDRLLDSFALFRLQVEGLEQLNTQSTTRMATICDVDHAAAETDQEEMRELMHEVGIRMRHIVTMRGLMEAIEAELKTRAVDPTAPAPAPSVGCEDIGDLDDPTLCQFCFGKPSDVEYACCRFRGSCGECAAKMHQLTQRCPHCRAFVGSKSPCR